jgi:enoyl-CoA hydratase
MRMRIERHDEVAVIHLETPPANAITGAFLEKLVALLDEAKRARAAVLTGVGKFFSGGLDLRPLIDLDRPTMRAFMTQFEHGMLKLFELPVPLVAAINGHAVAGGCVMALQCDVRLIADNDALRIGLNETQIGLGLPPAVVEPLVLQLPPKSMARVALQGELFSPRDALQVGLVDEVVPAAELLTKAIARAKAFAALPPAGLRHVKESLRKLPAARVRAHSDSEAERWLDTFYAPETQRVLRAVVAKLGAKP